MTQFQKVIKYLALALAFIIIINIATAVFSGLYALSNIYGDDNVKTSQKEETYNFNIKKINKLDVDVKFTELVIKEGTKLRVETDNKYIKVKEYNGELEIEEESHGLFSKVNTTTTIYIPKDVKFNDISISTGAGKIKIDSLNAKYLDFDIGAGKTDIDKLNVSSKAEIDGGAGKLTISSGTINNLELNMGVGKTTITSKLTGRSEIDSGVGELNINILDTIENYEVRASKGIGSIKLDDESIKDNQTYGNGENRIIINGGVGSININFNK